MSRLSATVVLCAWGALTVSCSKEKEKEEGDSGMATLAFDHDEGSGLTTDGLTPSYYGIKVIAVSLQTDASVDGQGHASSIYLNPDCGPSDLTSTIDDKEYKYVGVPTCTADQITQFFDLARSTAAVNTELNAQALPVLPGTYKFVSMGFCQGTPNAANLSFMAGDMAEAAEVKNNSCGVLSKEMDPPLELADGEAVTVTLQYDLTGMITAPDSASGNNCATVDGTTYCANFPTIVPTAKK